MQLHQNETFYCEILDSQWGSMGEETFQFGELASLIKRRSFYLRVGKAPDEKDGTNLYMVEGDKKVPIDLKKITGQNGEVWLKCYKTGI